MTSLVPVVVAAKVTSCCEPSGAIPSPERGSHRWAASMRPVPYDQMMRLETRHIFARYSNDKALELGEVLASLAHIEHAKVILNSGAGGTCGAVAVFRLAAARAGEAGAYVARSATSRAIPPTKDGSGG